MSEKGLETASTDTIFQGYCCKEEPRYEVEAERGNFRVRRQTWLGVFKEETTAYLYLVPWGRARMFSLVTVLLRTHVHLSRRPQMRSSPSLSTQGRGPATSPAQLPFWLLVQSLLTPEK